MLSRVAPNEMHWRGRWYRSLQAMSVAGEAAGEAGDFEPMRASFEMWWATHDRRYPWYDAEAVMDTRKYGMPAKALLDVSAEDWQDARVSVVAPYEDEHQDDHPTVSVYASGSEREQVERAFAAARAVLEDERSARDYRVATSAGEEAAEAEGLEAGRGDHRGPSGHDDSGRHARGA